MPKLLLNWLNSSRGDLTDQGSMATATQCNLGHEIETLTTTLGGYFYHRW